MHAIVLHQFFVKYDTLHEEFDPCDVVFYCELAEDVFERFPVPRPIVGWDANSKHHNRRTR